MVTQERIEIPTHKLLIRPDLFQARDQYGNEGVDPRKVRELVENYDPRRFDDLQVIPDPQQRDRYIILAGHHRLEAARKLNLDSVPVRVEHGVDITNPAGLKQARELAYASNFRDATQTVGEKLRVVRPLIESGYSATQIAKRLRLKQAEANRLIHYSRLPPGIIQELSHLGDDHPLLPVAAALGEAQHRFGFDEADAEATWGRYKASHAATGKAPTHATAYKHIKAAHFRRQQEDILAAAGVNRAQLTIGQYSGFEVFDPHSEMALALDLNKEAANAAIRKENLTRRQLKACQELANEYQIDIAELQARTQKTIQELSEMKHEAVQQALTEWERRNTDDNPHNDMSVKEVAAEIAEHKIAAPLAMDWVSGEYVEKPYTDTADARPEPGDEFKPDPDGQTEPRAGASLFGFDMPASPAATEPEAEPDGQTEPRAGASLFGFDMPDEAAPVQPVDETPESQIQAIKPRGEYHSVLSEEMLTEALKIAQERRKQAKKDFNHANWMNKVSTIRNTSKEGVMVVSRQEKRELQDAAKDAKAELKAADAALEFAEKQLANKIAVNNPAAAEPGQAHTDADAAPGQAHTDKPDA